MARFEKDGQGGNGTTNVHPKPAVIVNPPGREQKGPFASPPRGR